MATAETTKLSPLEVKRALNRNIVAGSFGMLFATCTGLQFATQFALQMGATNFQIGLLTSLPLLGYPLQLVAAYITERIRSRKPFWLITCVVHRLIWLLILAIPFVLGRSFPQWQVTAFLVLIFLTNALAIMASAPWFSWMADLVPPEQAGRFWSRRSAVLNAFMLTSLLCGRFVDMFPKHADAATGDWMPFVPFAVLFGLGCIFGELDIFIHSKIPEPSMREQLQKLNLLSMLQEPIRNPQFRRFLLWNCAWSFSVTLFSAYAMVFFLEKLHLSQFFISALVAASLVTRLLMARYWGYLADRFGHTAVNTICDFGLLAVPVTYLFVTPQNCYWLLTVMYAWAGIFGVGLDAASTALMLRLSNAENKSMSLAVLYSLVGIVAAVAPPLGGWILHHYEGHQTQFMFWSFDNFQMLFLVGLLMRLVSFFPFCLRLDDVGGGKTALVVRRLADTNPFRVIRSVHVLSESSGEAERLAAVHELASARSSIATKELVDALDDPSREVRREAAFALARIGDAESVEPLIRCLRSPDTGIQLQAAHALGKIRDARAVPALIEALKDPHLAQVAASALGDIGDHAAIEPLLHLLREPTVSEANRASFAYALSRLGETSALPDMLSALQTTQSKLVRQEMALAIGNLLGRTGGFYNLLARERQVAGQETSRLQGQMVRDKDRFKSNPALIEQVLRQVEDAHAAYNRGQWREACQGFARAGLLLAGSLPGEHAGEGMFDFLTDWFHPSRQKLSEPLTSPDRDRAPLWFLLAITYPQSHDPVAQTAQEECLLAFYAFWRIWRQKTREGDSPHETTPS